MQFCKFLEDLSYATKKSTKQEIWGIKKKITIFGTFLDRHKHILSLNVMLSLLNFCTSLIITSWDIEHVLLSSVDHHWHITTLHVTHLTNWHLQLPTKYRTKTPVSFNNTAQHFTRINTPLNGALDTTTISLYSHSHFNNKADAQVLWLLPFFGLPYFGKQVHFYWLINMVA